jgi:hypothetical protein
MQEYMDEMGDVDFGGGGIANVARSARRGSGRLS